jgi:hypothetical protein
MKVILYLAWPTLPDQAGTGKPAIRNLELHRQT